MTPTRFTPTRVLALLLLGAATVSSGVFAAPTTPSIRNSGLSSTGEARPAKGLQSRSSPEQGSLLDVQRRGDEHVNLVARMNDDNMSSHEEQIVSPSERFNRDAEDAISKGRAKLEECSEKAAGTTKPTLFRTDPSVAREIVLIAKKAAIIVFMRMREDQYREREEGSGDEEGEGYVEGEDEDEYKEGVGQLRCFVPSGKLGGVREGVEAVDEVAIVNATPREEGRGRDLTEFVYSRPPSSSVESFLHLEVDVELKNIGRMRSSEKKEQPEVLKGLIILSAFRRRKDERGPSTNERG
ncbi:hypothetical protein F5880DRAFT_1511219 [Lentinula raphanica]|nr:hypothetical protein F5880DRAFT_1511219 [Lentinula raphanica]